VHAAIVMRKDRIPQSNRNWSPLCASAWTDAVAKFIPLLILRWPERVISEAEADRAHRK
jgi:hypothetical protein